MDKGVRKFAQKRAIRHSKKLFIQVLEYIAFCYNRLQQDNREYSKTDVAFAFEEWLTTRFVEDYLRQLRSYFHHSHIKELQFYTETAMTYKTLAGEIRRDRIDICITNLNLGLQNYWSGIVKEDIYFAFECKRLKNTSKNDEQSGYLSDIRKFVEREYKFRIPFTGMIGFVENSSISIDNIINDINRRLRKSSTSITTTQELTPFEVKNFRYCRLSKHKKSVSLTLIEVYHLFFDYSKIIIE